MSQEPAKPSFTRAEVLTALRSAVSRRLEHTRNADSDLLKFGYDLEGVEELIAACTDDELHDHEVSHYYPRFYDYIAELKIDLEDEYVPFYVKVALHMKDTESGCTLSGSGELMSFHPWGMQR